MTLSPFDFVKSINNKTEELPTEDYNAFIINRALSFGRDTVLFADEMNCANHIPVSWQYAFLYHGISKKKRYDPWVKADAVDKDMAVIQEYYNISLQKAIECARILTIEQIEILKQRLKKGGRIKK